MKDGHGRSLRRRALKKYRRIQHPSLAHVPAKENVKNTAKDGNKDLGDREVGRWIDGFHLGGHVPRKPIMNNHHSISHPHPILPLIRGVESAPTKCTWIKNGSVNLKYRVKRRLTSSHDNLEEVYRIPSRNVPQDQKGCALIKRWPGKAWQYEAECLLSKAAKRLISVAAMTMSSVLTFSLDGGLVLNPLLQSANRTIVFTVPKLLLVHKRLHIYI